MKTLRVIPLLICFMACSTISRIEPGLYNIVGNDEKHMKDSLIIKDDLNEFIFISY